MSEERRKREEWRGEKRMREVYSFASGLNNDNLSSLIIYNNNNNNKLILLIIY
jgi:hypothetical protein